MIITCIPAYNEGKKISDVINRCKKFCDIILVCDDGSQDDTKQQAITAGANVISHEKNLGKGAALKSLFKLALEKNAEIIVTIDGDGQFLPEEISKIIKPITEKRADIVIGNRLDNPEEMPLYRKTGNKILDRITKIASQLPFKDTQSGFRAYNRKSIESINFSDNGFGADVEILIDAARKNCKILEEKVSVLYNIGEKTSTKNPVSHFSIVLTTLIELIAIRHPLKLLGIPGIILILIGIIFSVIVISFFNETRTFSIPSALIALGTLTIGLVFLLMSTVLYSIGRLKRL